MPSHQHYFHIKLLSLRANVMETIDHIFKDTVSFQSLELQSNRLLKLAREYDVFATSFADMDDESRMLISSHALSCSVLAFITGFSLFFNGSHKSMSNFYVKIIHDLMARIWYIDRETCKELMLLLETSLGQPKTHCVPQTQTLENTNEVRSIIKICLNAIRRTYDNNDGMKFALEDVKKLLNISSRTPNYFFKVKPCVSCQLFAMNRDCGNGGRISVMPGCHLHLDLCLQLRDMSSELKVRLTKFYCVLQCKMLCDGKSQMGMEFEDDVIELNEKIVKYVNDGDKIRRNDKDCRFDEGIAETIVGFRVNEEGQGFGNCVIDVSRFGFGCYEIKWRAGCVDVDGCYWSLNSLNSGPVFNVQRSC